MPAPTISSPSATSPRMPAHFWPSISTSFGHFSRAVTPLTRPIARTIARPSTAPVQPRRSAGIAGSRSSTENISPAPAGQNQSRPDRPRPVNCSSVVSTEEFGSPAAAARSAFVDPVTVVWVIVHGRSPVSSAATRAGSIGRRDSSTSAGNAPAAAAADSAIGARSERAARQRGGGQRVLVSRTESTRQHTIGIDVGRRHRPRLASRHAGYGQSRESHRAGRARAVRVDTLSR